MQNTNSTEDAFYTDNGQYIAPGYDRAQPAQTHHNYPTREQIERALTAPRPAGMGYQSATYLEPQAFARKVTEQHKQIWLSVYKTWRDALAKSLAEGNKRRIPLDQNNLDEAIEKLSNIGVSREQADQLIAEKRGTFAAKVAAQYRRENPEASEDDLEKIREVVAKLFDEDGNFIEE